MRVLAVTSVLVVLLATATLNAVAERGPSTPEERARAVKVARQLETDPLAESANSDRAWVLQWIDDIPDITVDLCSEMTGALAQPDKSYARELFAQDAISMAAFIIEHPDKVGNEVAIQRAGLEGMLKAYQAILKSHPAARREALDELIQKRNQGELSTWVGQMVSKCFPTNQT